MTSKRPGTLDYSKWDDIDTDSSDSDEERWVSPSSLYRGRSESDYKDGDDGDSVEGYSRAESLGCNGELQGKLEMYADVFTLMRRHCGGEFSVVRDIERLFNKIYSGAEGMFQLNPPMCHMDIGTWSGEQVFTHAQDIVGCPAWPRFCRDLQACPPGAVDGLTLKEIKVTNGLLDGLSPALKYAQHLYLEKCIFGKKGLSILANHLEGNGSLLHMRLMSGVGNELSNLDTVRRFFGALGNHPTLEHFCMSRHLRCENREALSIIMNGVRNVKKVSFCWLNCPGEGHRIASVLASNPGVEDLMAGCESFNSKDAVDFAKALATNTNLRKLRISIADEFFDPETRERYSSIKDGITKEVAAKALLKAVYDPSGGLNGILDQNHTCTINDFDKESEPFQTLNKLIDSGCSREIIIKHKLLHALGAHEKMNFNIEQLYGLELELLPRVFGLLQGTSDGKTALSNVFLTMKNYVVPLMDAPLVNDTTDIDVLIGKVQQIEL